MAVVNDKKYEALLIKHNYFYSDYKKAIELVKNFIIANDLIIYGGTAIDFALTLKGAAKIYDSDMSFPDYDFYSPSSVKHAYELAQILYIQGISNISAIGAYHVQTMRVRTNTIAVADISYCPQNVFVKIPTLKYEKFRIIHPHYQMMALHLSMCFPFNNAPREVILDRKNKDYERYDLLFDAYPVTSSIKKYEQRVIEFNTGDNVVLCGLAAYAILYDLMSSRGVRLDLHPYAHITQRNGGKFTLKLDWTGKVDPTISIISYRDPSKARDDPSYKNSYMNILPPSLVRDNIQEFMYFNKRLHVTRIGENLISSTQYSMLLMLFYYFKTSQEMYLNYYLGFKHMTERAIEMFPLDKIKDVSPFIIPMQFWPNDDTPTISDSLSISLANTRNYIEKTPGSKTFKPRSYYPATSEMTDFNYEDSPFFQIDGE
jgi:hypothetical protein